MLNKLSYNLMNALNESEEIEVKKITYTANTYLNENCKEEKLDENIETSEEKDAIEERLASLKTQLEVDGEQLADDEKEAIKAEIAELENQLAEDEVDNKIMNESASGTDAYDKLVQGDDVYFRNEEGIALLGHYADNYPEPEEYDEGFKPEYGGTEEGLQKAKEAADNRDVWEFMEVFEDTLQPMNEVYAYVYGQDDLMEMLKTLRQVNVVKKLEENQIEDARKDSIEKGLISEEESEFKVGDIVKVPYKYGSYTPGEFTEAPIIDISEGRYVTVEIPSKLEVTMDQLKKWNTLGECDEPLKEDSYDSGIFYEIEQAFEEAGLNPIRFIDDGILTRNIGWTVSSNGVSQQISCDGSWYDEDEDDEEYNESAKCIKEAYSERYGGDPKDFVSDVEAIKAKLSEIDTSVFGSKLAAQMVEDWIETCNYQIEKGKRLASGNEFYTEADNRTYKDRDEAEYYRNKELYANSNLARHREAMEKAKKACEEKRIKLDECDTPIAEAEVKGLKEVKNQGNVYMLEDETNKFIVGENYNADEGLIENAEVYESKEEADKDYLGRCEITGGQKEIKESVEKHDLSKDIFGDEANKRASDDQRAYEKYLALAKEVKDGKNDTITLDSAKQLLKNAYVKAKGYYSFEPEEIDRRIAKDIPELFSVSEN